MQLEACAASDDTQRAHIRADTVLVEFLNALGYADVTAVYGCVPKWYA